MPRPLIDPEHRKINLTLRLPKYLVDQLKEVDGYNNLVEILLKDYFTRKKSEK